ncbi:MAG: hypothetical protein ONB44_15230 [candidate division KSB1 bacterium]|nr:hypothetical protein [candidate division KSB1 bacterium]MDZ7303482.1 hypothetical protein [candidate division KSB1 bacterium]MDZ7312716.1 hypothetical protein [candidate division KSB1 bacterium]
MRKKTVHEPKAKVMSAIEVWDDAQQIATILRQNLSRAEPVVRLQIPLSALLSALDSLGRDELVILQKRVKERLVA